MPLFAVGKLEKVKEWSPIRQSVVMISQGSLLAPPVAVRS
jgi:hypothetical protein